MERRIIEQIMTWTDVDRTTLPAWLRSLGVVFHPCPEGNYLCTGLTGIRSNFSAKIGRLDMGPVVGILLAGIFFSQVYPKLLSGLDKALKTEKKSQSKKE